MNNMHHQPTNHSFLGDTPWLSSSACSSSLASKMSRRKRWSGDSIVVLSDADANVAVAVDALASTDMVAPCFSPGSGASVNAMAWYDLYIFLRRAASSSWKSGVGWVGGGGS